MVAVQQENEPEKHNLRTDPWPHVHVRATCVHNYVIIARVTWCSHENHVRVELRHGHAHLGGPSRERVIEHDLGSSSSWWWELCQATLSLLVCMPDLPRAVNSIGWWVYIRSDDSSVQTCLSLTATWGFDKGRERCGGGAQWATDPIGSEREAPVSSSRGDNRVITWMILW